jgi:hypothetical protein
MNCNDLRAHMGAAIADLELQKQRLLEIFDWGSLPGCIDQNILGRHAMTLALVRTSLPVIDIELRKTFKGLTGSEPPSLEWPK